MSNQQEVRDPLRCPEFEAIATLIQAAAQARRGDSHGLLALLRLLEELHRQIRDDLFQDSLPDNRQALYKLLRDIETQGGWPYIHRMKLQSLFAKIAEDAEGCTEVAPASEQ